MIGQSRPERTIVGIHLIIVRVFRAMAEMHPCGATNSDLDILDFLYRLDMSVHLFLSCPRLATHLRRHKALHVLEVANVNAASWPANSVLLALSVLKRVMLGKYSYDALYRKDLLQAHVNEELHVWQIRLRSRASMRLRAHASKRYLECLDRS